MWKLKEVGKADHQSFQAYSFCKADFRGEVLGPKNKKRFSDEFLLSLGSLPVECNTTSLKCFEQRCSLSTTLPWLQTSVAICPPSHRKRRQNRVAVSNSKMKPKKRFRGRTVHHQHPRQACIFCRSNSSLPWTESHICRLISSSCTL